MRWLDSITTSIDMFEQIPGDGRGQGSLVCCSLWAAESQQPNSERVCQWNLVFLKISSWLHWVFFAACSLSLVVENRGFCCVQALGVWSSVVVAHGLRCSTACGILPTQGSNLCLLSPALTGAFFTTSAGWEAPSPLLGLSFAGIFSQSVAFLFIVFHRAETFIFNEVQFISYFFHGSYFWNYCQTQGHLDFLLFFKKYLFS